MNWHWDSSKNEEVCYTKAGIEYIAYIPGSRKYVGPGRPTSDEVGSIFEDSFSPKDTGECPIERWLSGLELESSGSSSDGGLSHFSGHGPRHDSRASGTSSAHQEVSWPEASIWML